MRRQLKCLGTLGILTTLALLAPACSSTQTLMGYGRGESMGDATRAAWVNAQEKLTMSGLRDYILLEDKMLQMDSFESAGQTVYNVTIRFKARPPEKPSE